MSMGALIEKFRTVGLDRLERMNGILVSLEREPDDADGVEELLREIHTLKGEAKMMGFADINLVAHQTENILLAITDGLRLTSTEPVDLLFQGLDLMRGLLTKSAGDAAKNLDLNGFIDRVVAFSHPGLATSQAHPHTHPEPEPASDEALDEAPHPAQTPEVSPTQSSSPGPTTRTRIKTLNPERDPAVDAGSLRIQTSATLRVDIDKLERLGDLAGDTLLMGRRLSYRLSDLHQVRVQLRELFAQIESNLPKSRSMALRNLVHRFDACEAALREENHLVNLRASQLDERARTLRHIPLAQVLSHYPRAVRDLAHSQGKKIRLVHTFGNVEVDRAILSALSEPLLHLVRNAVDHGIESPEERQALGKEPEGEIRLSADYFGDSIRVVLTDDGRGVNPDEIRQKAAQRGLLPGDQADRLTDQEAIALIFEPGFTTREQASDLSGRGIGMDVVRRQIARIGGFIEIESQVHQGTSITLHLPVSSAVNSVLVFAIGARHFALTAKDIVRVEMVGHSQLKKVHGGVCVLLDDQLIPLVDWAGPLGLDDRGRPPDPLTIILVRKGARRVALWVDEVIGEREAVSRPLGDFLAGLRLCRGVALTDSGAVVPLLNIVDLMEQSASEARVELDTPDRARSFTAVQGRRALTIKTILVVEDSEVTRSLVVSILKNHGYRVLEADDGIHGWNRLQRHRVDLVLTDIQMPGMTGLELLQHIRASDQHARLPVIILSTLGEAEDKKRAMTLGANGYLVKLSFQEQDLLDTVQRYLS